jgi:hypothetical protein
MGHAERADGAAMTFVIWREDEVIGYVSRDDSCEAPACIAARAAGRPWHVTPAGFATTLPTYHYATREGAGVALYRAMLGRHGRKPALAVADDHEWRTV